MLVLNLSFYTHTAPTQIYTLSLHDALPIYQDDLGIAPVVRIEKPSALDRYAHRAKIILDRKSTRLNSSHSQISYAVFCLKKKTKHNRMDILVITMPYNTRMILTMIRTARNC